jgi:hypothetical protein
MAGDEDINQPERSFLERIESEGQEAAKAAAEKLVQEMLARGGQIDIDRLHQSGPDVEEAYMRIVSESAATAASAGPASAPGGPEPAPASPKRTAQKKSRPTVVVSEAPTAHVEDAALPRVKTGWPELRCEESGFAITAFLTGLAAASVLGLFTSFAIAHFKF